MNARRVALLVLGAALALACQPDAPTTEPEGGFAAFRDALMTQEPDEIYPHMSAEIHGLFEDALDSLREMESRIERLQPSDRAQARRETGVVVLERIDSPSSLFARILREDQIPIELDVETGLNVIEARPDEEGVVTVITEAGDEFVMHRDEDGRWRVHAPFYELFAAALDPIDENRAALELAIEYFGHDETSGERSPEQPSAPPSDGSGSPAPERQAND